MSHYIKTQAQFLNQTALVAALIAVGFDRTQVQVNPEGQKLNDYGGRKTQNIGHVVIPREHVGSSCNDIGFNTANGDVWICDYAKNRANVPAIRDAFKGHGDAFVNRLKQEYAFAVTQDTYAQQGQLVERVDAPDGKIHAYVQC